MKRVFWINPVIFAAIILLLASGCKKEEHISVISKKSIADTTSVLDSKTATDTISVTDTMPGYSSILEMFPEVIERNASNVTPHRATLNADIKTRDLPVVVVFQMWRDSTGSSPFDFHTVMADQSPVPANTIIQVSATFTGLKPDTFYSWKVFLYISIGGHVYATGCALNPCVTPTGMPPVITLPANNIIKDGATLNGNVYANDLSTKVTFEYGETTNYGNTVTASQSPISGEIITDVSANITGLKAGTIYHFRVISANSTGTNYGDDLTFKATNNVPGQATGLPGCQTLWPTYDSITGVTLNGTVNAYGFYTKVSFEYGTTITYGQEVTSTPGAVTQDGDVGVSAAITGLPCGEEYHFRLITENSFGISYGEDFTFVGGLKRPTLTTTPASDITATSAMVGGIITDDGCSAIDERGVFYTIKPDVLLPVNQFPKKHPCFRTFDGAGTGSFTSNLTGLQPGTTYYVRAYAHNGHLGATGNIISFTTTR